MKKIAYITAAIGLLFQGGLSAHCQMPCGIYHDNMVYDQIDQYSETMYKAVSEIKENKFQTPAERNQLVRWVYQKDVQSDEISSLISTYFLQQKIKPGEEDTTKKITSAQKLLFLVVQIKQNVDLKLVYEFMEEWNNFKLMFHREGYECRIETMKLKKWKEEHEALKAKEATTKAQNPPSKEQPKQ